MATPAYHKNVSINVKSLDKGKEVDEKSEVTGFEHIKDYEFGNIALVLEHISKNSGKEDNIAQEVLKRVKNGKVDEFHFYSLLKNLMKVNDSGHTKVYKIINRLVKLKIDTPEMRRLFIEQLWKYIKPNAGIFRDDYMANNSHYCKNINFVELRIILFNIPLAHSSIFTLSDARLERLIFNLLLAHEGFRNFRGDNVIDRVRALTKCFIDVPLEFDDKNNLYKTTTEFENVVTDLEIQIASVNKKEIHLDNGSARSDAVKIVEHTIRSGLGGLTNPLPKNDSQDPVVSASRNGAASDKQSHIQAPNVS